MHVQKVRSLPNFLFHSPILHETWSTRCARLTFFTRLAVRTSWIIWFLNARHAWYTGLTLGAFFIAYFAKAFDTVLTFQTLLTLLASLAFRRITILARGIVYTWNARNTWCTTQTGFTIITSFTFSKSNHIRLFRTQKKNFIYMERLSNKDFCFYFSFCF